MMSKSFMSYRRKELSPDLTPLIDVVFLLLIFFMVATNFDKLGGMKIDLPHSESALTEALSETVSVVIDKNNQMKLKIEKNGTVDLLETTMEKLSSDLEGKIGHLSDKRVGIIADRDVSHGDIVDVMTAIKDSGANSIDIEMKRK
ncbi:MAG: ExbD/TolR family protein [Fusobacteriaceae bacterium]